MYKAVRIAWEDRGGESLFKVFKTDGTYTGAIISAKGEEQAIRRYKKFQE